MKITGIICEYNPFHLGHRKQLALAKTESDAIVCLMSGNYVQRGAPAVFDKISRAETAVRCGADLVLELPTTVSLRSAEGFAAGGVEILSPFCTHLSFGAENAQVGSLMGTAEALLREDFPQALHLQLDKGLSFPAARQAALESMGVDASLLQQPNNILAVEYCKAILSQKAKLTPLPILRQGSYHDTTPDKENPSATSVRKLIEQAKPWQNYVPAEATVCFHGNRVHALKNAETAILGRLRSMTEEEFSQLPYGSEGLWRKLMHAVRQKATLEEILTAVKSKRYTRSRLDRMVLCAFLGIRRDMLHSPAPYVRVLGFNDTGRKVLKLAREHGSFPNIGEDTKNPYQLWEHRWGDLYGLFAPTPEKAGTEKEYRVYYHN
ncbi:MAG: nucleotidyltransferase family protein [Oscillospiraceae bacterium]|nr:nucleotidyltransferase family protein [Oscillospiraceae bacterium]